MLKEKLRYIFPCYKLKWAVRWQDFTVIDIGSKSNKLEKKENLEKESFLKTVEKGNAKAVSDLLFSNGLLVLETDDTNENALHKAAGIGDLTMILLLLENGCGKEEENFNGWTPLLKAAFNGQTYAFKQLLMAGCSYIHIDKDKRNFLHLAALSGNDEIILKGANLDDGEMERLINSEDIHHKTPLQLAQERGNIKVIKALEELIRLKTRYSKVPVRL